MAYDPKNCLPKDGAGAFGLPGVPSDVKRGNAGFGPMLKAMHSRRGVSKRRALALHVRPHLFKKRP